MYGRQSRDRFRICINLTLLILTKVFKTKCFKVVI